MSLWSLEEAYLTGHGSTGCFVRSPGDDHCCFFVLFSNVFSELNIFQGSASASARHIRFSSPVATVAHGAAPTRCVPGVPSNAPAQRPEWMSSRNCKLLETLIGECTNQHEPTNCNRPNKQNTSTKQTEH